jgi:hypothetical protein
MDEEECEEEDITEFIEIIKQFEKAIKLIEEIL